MILLPNRSPEEANAVDDMIKGIENQKRAVRTVLTLALYAT
jgi:hypothetical protein